MPENPRSMADVTAFLDGDRRLLDEIRSAVDGVVRSFRSFDAELHGELVQDSIARLVVSLNRGLFRGEASLKTYAQQVARNTCLEHIRARRSDVDVDPEMLPAGGGFPSPEASLIRTEEHRRNLRLLASLPPESRELLRLIFEEGLSYREVASRLGLSEGAIKSRVRRLRLETLNNDASNRRPRSSVRSRAQRPAIRGEDD